MTGTLKAVVHGLLVAADEFSVPRSTPKDRLLVKVVHGARSGPNPYHSSKEVNKLNSH